MPEDNIEVQPIDTELREKLNARRWKNRRRMAWLSLLSIIAITIMSFYYVDIERLKVLDSVITWFYTVMGSVVGAYVGFSTWHDVKKDE